MAVKRGSPTLTTTTSHFVPLQFATSNEPTLQASYVPAVPNPIASQAGHTPIIPAAISCLRAGLRSELLAEANDSE